MRWIQRSQRSFSGFFLIFIGGYFLWPYSLQRHPKYQFSDSTEIRLAHSSKKYSCNSVSGSHTSQSSFSESFFPVFIWGYLRFHHRPPWAYKYHFANSARTVLANGFLRGNCNSVRLIHRTQRSFSESFFLILIVGYFPWPYSLEKDPKYQFADSTEIRLAHNPTKYSCNWMSGSHTWQSSFSERFYPVFIWGYLRFHHGPLWASKYPFANSTRTVLANGFWRGKL